MGGGGLRGRSGIGALGNWGDLRLRLAFVRFGAGGLCEVAWRGFGLGIPRVCIGFFCIIARCGLGVRALGSGGILSSFG